MSSCGWLDSEPGEFSETKKREMGRPSVSALLFPTQRQKAVFACTMRLSASVIAIPERLCSKARWASRAGWWAKARVTLRGGVFPLGIVRLLFTKGRGLETLSTKEARTLATSRPCSGYWVEVSHWMALKFSSVLPIVMWEA